MIFTSLLFVALAAYGVLAVRFPRIALPLFVALLPSYLIRFSIGPLPTTFLELCFWMLFGVWVCKRMVVTDANRYDGWLKKVRLVFANKTFLYSVGVFSVLSLASLAVVPHEHLVSSLGLWRAYVLEPFLFGWMLWSERRSAAWLALRAQCFLSLALSGFILAVIGIMQYVTRAGIPAPWDIERRITSVFDYPNALGLFLAPLLSALLVFGVSTWKQRASHEKMFTVGASVAMLLAILLAKTEAALVAVPAALFITFLLSPLTQRKQKIAVTCLAMVALVGAFMVAPVREKLLLQDFSGGVRLSQWKETAHLLLDHPLTGAGFGYYPLLLREYHTDWQYEIFQDPHNILLNAWVELGVLGVGCGVWGVFYLAKKTWERRNDALVLAAGAAILTMCIHGLVDVPFFKNDLAMMTVFFVVLVLVGKQKKDA